MADKNFDDGIEIDSGESGNLVANNTANKNGDKGICAPAGTAIDGGGNTGKKNGTPPDVDFDC